MDVITEEAENKKNEFISLRRENSVLNEVRTSTPIKATEEIKMNNKEDSRGNHMDDITTEVKEVKKNKKNRIVLAESVENIEKGKKKVNDSSKREKREIKRTDDLDGESAEEILVDKDARSSTLVDKNPNSKSMVDISQSEQASHQSKMNRTKSYDALANGSKSFDYRYFVIASPSMRRKFSDSVSNETTFQPLMSNSASSFVSTSTCDTETSLSSISKQAKRSPKSKAVLEAIKRKLQNEICKIDIEISKMEGEKLVLLNLRNIIMEFKEKVTAIDRNKQGVLMAEKVRNALVGIVEIIQSEEQALDENIVMPHLDDVKGELSELSRLGRSIIDYKACLHLTSVEGFFIAAGKIFGMVECILLLYYEDENEELDSLNEWNSKNSSLCSDDQKMHSVSSFTEELIRNECTTEYGGDHSLPLTRNEINKPRELKEALKVFTKRINKARKSYHSVERLSSGIPKMKTLCRCFKDILSTLDDGILLTGRTETVFQEVNENVCTLTEILKSERPGQRELEHSKMIMGEMTGRIKILSKSDLVDLA